MFRPILAATSALSLPLCLAAGVLWVRSYRGSDEVAWVNDDGRHVFRTAQGHAVVSMNLADGFRPGVDERGVRYSRAVAREIGVELMWPLFLCSDATARWTQYQWRGFAWLERRTNQGLLATAAAPFWSLTIATAIPPAAWTLALLLGPRQALRRQRRGLCAACGYDAPRRGDVRSAGRSRRSPRPDRHDGRADLQAGASLNDSWQKSDICPCGRVPMGHTAARG